MNAVLERDVTLPEGSQDDEELTLTAAARRLGLTPAALRNQYYAGKLTAEMRGRDLWVKWSEVQRYLRERKHEGRYRGDIQPEGTNE